MALLNNTLEFYISIVSLLIAAVGSFFILRINWKSYGLLYMISAVLGNIICYLFVKFGFYSFPYIFLPIAKIPLVAVTTAFSFYVLFGVRYSPKSWPYKIAYYGVIVNIGMTLETIFKTTTRLIEYNFEWDFWDSYTSWWAFFILMEWIGGKIVPAHSRKPLAEEFFRFGNWFFFIVHFIAILTIFLAGYHLGAIKR